MPKVRLLDRASRAPIYGAGVAAELGQPVSTLYPLLGTMEAARFVRRDTRVVAGKVRKYYRITPRGRRVLAELRRAVVDTVSALDGSQP